MAGNIQSSLQTCSLFWEADCEVHSEDSHNKGILKCLARDGAREESRGGQGFYSDSLPAGLPGISGSPYYGTCTLPGGSNSLYSESQEKRQRWNQLAAVLSLMASLSFTLVKSVSINKLC